MNREVVLERLTTAQAARRANVSEQSIRSWVKSGRLRAETTPYGSLVDASDLDDVIADRAIAQRQGTNRERRRWGLTEGAQ